MTDCNVILYRYFIDSSKISKKESKWVKDNNANIINIDINKSRFFIDSISDIKRLVFQGKLGALSDESTLSKPIVLLFGDINEIDRENVHNFYADIYLLMSLGINMATTDCDHIYTKDEPNAIHNLIFKFIELWEAKKSSLKKSNSAAKVWSVKRELIESGETPKLKSPAWFTYDEQNKKYILNDLSKSVKLCFEKYLDNKSMSATARLLNDMNINTLGSAKKWGQTSVRQILVNKATYGLLDVRTFQHEDFYPGVISKDTFYLTQAEIKRRNSTNSDPILSNLKTSNILTKIAKCGVCGMNLYLHGKKQYPASGEIQDYRYLTCSSRKYNNEKCKLPSFRYKYVEAIVIVVAGLLENMPHEHEAVERVAYLRGTLGSLKNDKAALEIKIEQLADLISEIGIDIIKDKIKSLNVDLENINNKIYKTLEDISTINKFGGIEGAYKKISELSKDLSNDDNRAEFIINLSTILDVCDFNQDGSIFMKSMNNDIFINQTKGEVIIKMPHVDVTLDIS
ncbi:hypothetical protein PE36_00210 [Moritella sp. PE36]|uniref:recombinase family protein n=1 Tax=Moritella sp. PE36 TaxID=58051 RepID=UPI000156928B|nr:recombinase family protein [Moritella sp. PE36]EDM66173.1 hypothetical protein PE36_00210 [Moritella sp. PE36]